MIKLTDQNQRLFQELRLQLRTAYIHAVVAVKGLNAHDKNDLEFTDKIENRLELLFIEAGKVLGSEKADPLRAQSSQQSLVVGLPTRRSPPWEDTKAVLDQVEAEMRDVATHVPATDTATQ